MTIFLTILLIAVAIIILIGLIRVIFFVPYTGFLDFILDMLLIDLLSDALGDIFECIGDLWD